MRSFQVRGGMRAGRTSPRVPLVFMVRSDTSNKYFFHIQDFIAGRRGKHVRDPQKTLPRLSHSITR